MITHWCQPGDRTRLIDNSTFHYPSSLKPKSISLHNVVGMSGLSKSDSPTLAVIILAGGKSSRMGIDKALLPFENKTLLEKLLVTVKPLTSDIVVMLSRQLQLADDFLDHFPGVIIGRDSIAERGPLQGIADAVGYLPRSADPVMVLSCDLPFISTSWLTHMMQRFNESKDIDVVCVKQGKHLNPLIAVYRIAVLLEAGRYLEAGKQSCLALLDHSRVKTVEPSDTESELVSNINTPQEYALALQKYRSSL